MVLTWDAALTNQLIRDLIATTLPVQLLFGPFQFELLEQIFSSRPAYFVPHGNQEFEGQRSPHPSRLLCHDLSLMSVYCDLGFE